MTKNELRKAIFAQQFKLRSKQLIAESEARLAKLTDLLNNLNKDMENAN